MAAADAKFTTRLARAAAAAALATATAAASAAIAARRNRRSSSRPRRSRSALHGRDGDKHHRPPQRARVSKSTTLLDGTSASGTDNATAGGCTDGGSADVIEIIDEDAKARDGVIDNETCEPTHSDASNLVGVKTLAQAAPAVAADAPSGLSTTTTRTCEPLSEMAPDPGLVLTTLT